MDVQKVFYILDNADRIVAVGGDWDRFAIQNDGPGALSDEVLGRPLYASIHGDEVRMLLQALMSFVRTMGQPITRAYRCDSPSVKRTFSMTVTPLDGGSLQVVHEPTEVTQLPKIVQFEYHLSASPSSIARCSFCNRFLMGKEWREPDVLEFSTGRLNVVNDVCGECRQELQSHYLVPK